MSRYTQKRFTGICVIFSLMLILIGCAGVNPALYIPVDVGSYIVNDNMRENPGEDFEDIYSRR